jgi:hypothetical protein
MRKQTSILTPADDVHVYDLLDFQLHITVRDHRRHLFVYRDLPCLCTQPAVFAVKRFYPRGLREWKLSPTDSLRHILVPYLPDAVHFIDFAGGEGHSLLPVCCSDLLFVDYNRSRWHHLFHDPDWFHYE